MDGSDPGEILLHLGFRRLNVWWRLVQGPKWPSVVFNAGKLVQTHCGRQELSRLAQGDAGVRLGVQTPRRGFEASFDLLCRALVFPEALPCA